MQKTATNIFIISSICFGLVGLVTILSRNFGPSKPDSEGSSPVLINLLFTCVFFILPSFAVSVAGKFLSK